MMIINDNNIKQDSLAKKQSPPVFVLSLDFELHWGFQDKVKDKNHPYWENLQGTRQAVEELLNLFIAKDIHVTWGIVGRLFANSQDEFDHYFPKPKFQTTPSSSQELF